MQNKSMAIKILWMILAALPLLAVDASFPDPALDAKKTSAKQTAVFAGGCFWCVEAVFEIMEGVDDVISGYSGDTQEKAKYDIVSSGCGQDVRTDLVRQNGLAGSRVEFVVSLASSLMIVGTQDSEVITIWLKVG